MKIILIEDEKPAARLLKRRVEKLGYEITEMLHSVEESVAWLKTNSQPDLIFLDIQLSDGLSFEIFNQVDVSSAIIFTTAYDEYVLKAFKLNSVDYLLKPVDEEELKFALEKFEKQHQPKSSFDLSEIKKLFTNQSESYKERFSVKIGTSIKIIESDNIECFFSENKVANIIGALSYAFSAWVIFFLGQMPFVSFYALLPLYFIGIELYFRKDRHILFIISVAILLFTNYYFFFSLSMFC